MALHHASSKKGRVSIDDTSSICEHTECASMPEKVLLGSVSRVLKQDPAMNSVMTLVCSNRYQQSLVFPRYLHAFS